MLRIFSHFCVINQNVNKYPNRNANELRHRRLSSLARKMVWMNLIVSNTLIALRKK